MHMSQNLSNYICLLVILLTPFTSLIASDYWDFEDIALEDVNEKKTDELDEIDKLDKGTKKSEELDEIDLLDKSLKKKDRKCENCALSPTELLNNALDDLKSEIDELKDQIKSLEQEQDALLHTIQGISEAPSEALQAETNFVAVGTAYAMLSFPRHFNQNYEIVIDPVFLYRYRDNFLFEMKLDIALSDCNTIIGLVYGVLDYVVNDCLTVRAGKFSTPLGFVWEKMTTGWINKLTLLPPPYNPRFLALTPAADIGLNLRGAFPIGWYRCKDCIGIPFVLAWDFWVANGPSESNCDIQFNCNTLDNNYNMSVGGRLGFRFFPYREIGVSGMYAQWNNNRHKSITAKHGSKFYTAFVIDWNWGLNKYSKLMGEFISTHRDALRCPALKLCRDVINEQGGWIQYSTFLGMFPCKYWENVELVTRWGFVESDLRDRRRRELAFGANYYFTNTLILKFGYYINHGKAYRDTLFNIQLASAY